MQSKTKLTATLTRVMWFFIGLGLLLTSIIQFPAIYDTQEFASPLRFGLTLLAFWGGIGIMAGSSVSPYLRKIYTKSLLKKYGLPVQETLCTFEVTGSRSHIKTYYLFRNESIKVVRVATKLGFEDMQFDTEIPSSSLSHFEIVSSPLHEVELHAVFKSKAFDQSERESSKSLVHVLARNQFDSQSACVFVEDFASKNNIPIKHTEGSALAGQNGAVLGFIITLLVLTIVGIAYLWVFDGTFNSTLGIVFLILFSINFSIFRSRQ